MVRPVRDRAHSENWNHALYTAIAPDAIAAALDAIQARLPPDVVLVGTLAKDPPPSWNPSGSEPVRMARVLVGPLWTWFLLVQLPGKDAFSWRLAPWADPLSEHGITEVVATIWRSWAVVTGQRVGSA